MQTIDVTSSNALSLTSHALSCKRFKIIGPKFSIPEPFKLSTSKARFGDKKCSIDNCVNLIDCTAS